MENIAASPVKKAFGISLIVTVLAGLVFGTSFIAQNKTKTELAESTAQSQTTVAAVDTNTAVLGEQTTQNAGYKVVASQISSDATYTSFKITITNTSANTLQFSPGLQLQFVGIVTGSVHTLVVPSGSVVFNGGPIAAGTSISGTVYFVSFANESGALHFIPDVSSTSFIVVQ